MPQTTTTVPNVSEGTKSGFGTDQLYPPVGTGCAYPAPDIPNLWPGAVNGNGTVVLRAACATACTQATAGTPGTWTPPSGAIKPANAAQANNWGLAASPGTAWVTTGQYVQGATAGAPGEMYWNGSAWVAGRRP